MAASYEPSRLDLHCLQIQVLCIFSFDAFGYERLYDFQDPSFVFTEEFQNDFLTEYHKVFDKLRTEFLVGEMVWNFADFMTVQRKYG